MKSEPLGIGGNGRSVLLSEQTGPVPAEERRVVPSHDGKNGVPALLAFFGLTRQPFGVTPDPSFLYLGHTHREALASLVYGVETGLGFMTLIAKPGMGKTTLLFSLLERCRNSARSAFLFQTQCTSRELLQFIMSELGQQGHGHDFVHMHDEFNKYLTKEARAGRRVLVVVDEAHNLDASVLETIRLLSNFETAHAKLLQIVLSGQPELADKLASPNMVQLRQRVSLVSQLEPLSAEDVRHYIEHRLSVSGYTGKSLLTVEALKILTEFAQGIPRNVNNFCFNALSLAFASQTRIVDELIADEVIRDLDVSPRLSEADHHNDGVTEWTSTCGALPARSAVLEKGIEHQAVAALPVHSAAPEKQPSSDANQSAVASGMQKDEPQQMGLAWPINPSNERATKPSAREYQPQTLAESVAYIGQITRRLKASRT